MQESITKKDVNRRCAEARRAKQKAFDKWQTCDTFFEDQGPKLWHEFWRLQAIYRSWQAVNAAINRGVDPVVAVLARKVDFSEDYRW